MPRLLPPPASLDARSYGFPYDETVRARAACLYELFVCVMPLQRAHVLRQLEGVGLYRPGSLGLLAGPFRGHRGQRAACHALPQLITPYCARVRPHPAAGQRRPAAAQRARQV